MGRGSQEQAYQGSLIYASIKGTKEGESVHFKLQRPNDADKKNPIDEGTEKRLSGYLVKAEHRPWVYQERNVDSIRLLLNDPQAGSNGESYLIEFTLASGLGRSIVNSLLNAENFMPMLSISLYNSKENGYANAGVYLGGDPLNWKYSIEDQNKHVTIEKVKEKDKSGKVVTKEKKNYLELNDFLLEEFKKNVIPMVKPRNSQKSEATVYDGAEQTQSAAADIPEEEVMPWDKP